MSNELKPCPCCGSEIIEVDHDSMGWYAHCADCGLNLSAQKDKSLLIATWNRRTGAVPEQPIAWLYKNKGMYDFVASLTSVDVRLRHKYFPLYYAAPVAPDHFPDATKMVPAQELSDDDLRIIYVNDDPDGIPYGIRDRGGFLFFFTDLRRYEGQEARYKEEFERKRGLANYLLKSLADRVVLAEAVRGRAG